MTVAQVEKKATARLGHLSGVHPSIHHMPISTLRDLGHGGNEPGNLDAAAAAAKAVYDNWPNQKWRNGFIMALTSYIDDQVAYHRGELQALLDKSAIRTVAKARKAIMKSYIEDTLEEVAKDSIRVRGYTTRAGTRVSSYTQERQRAARERENNPALGGYDPSYLTNVSTRQEARQQGAMLAAQMVDAYGAAQGARTAANKQAVEYHIMKPDGKIEVHRPAPGNLPSMNQGEDIIVRAKPLGFARPVNLGQAHFNVAQALGTPQGEAARQGAITQNFQTAVSAETGDWGKRLIGMANVLHHATKGTNPQVDAAMAMARAVGHAGPEVSKVLGGHIRRHMYRYRGVQADPSQWTNEARSGRQTTGQGANARTETPEAFQRRLTLNLARDTKQGGLQAVPTQEEVSTALKTGNTPPSHGYLLDKNGVVKAQAHGYADDHYVPFNLADLHDLNGGSYTRSRAYGGPTTEDFSLASRTGAKSFETVSRNGIFRVEFTPRTNKSGRKIGQWALDTANDANTAMVNRYGRILDAIKHGNVNDPANPGQHLTLDGRGYEVALETLRKQFPYFIKSVEYTPAKDVKELQGKHGEREDDKGYVRPYYLKPQTARQGYWDPKLRSHGDPTTFDEDDRYRLGMARLLANRRPGAGGGGQAGPGGVVGGAGSPPRGTPGAPAPTTVSPQQQRIAQAVGGDYGPAVSEVERQASMTRIAPEEMPAYIEWVRAALAEAPPDVFNGHDSEAIQARKVRDMFTMDPFEASDPQAANQEQDDYLYDIQHDPDKRAELEQLLYQITPDSNESVYWDRPVLASLGEHDEDLPETPEEVHASEEGKEYKEYQRVKGWLNTGRDKLGDAKKAEYDRIVPIWTQETRLPNGKSIGSRMSRYENDVMPETGLTAKEEFENRLDEAEGREPRHSPKVREEQIAESAHLTQQEGESDAAYEERMNSALDTLASQGGDTAVEPDVENFPVQGEDESDEDYERRSDEWIDKFTRGLGDRDY